MTFYTLILLLLLVCVRISGVAWDVAKDTREQRRNACYDRWTDRLAICVAGSFCQGLHAPRKRHLCQGPAFDQRCQTGVL